MQHTFLDWEFTATNGKPCKIHIWDFGGQEIYHATHQFFLPKRWFNLKQTLETLDQDFISLERYITLCAQNGITEEADQDQLIRLLHNLGIVLNFRDHPILQTTNILNPHWVTSGIYSLLSDPKLKTIGRGILTPADLDRVLPTDRYPKTRHHCLLELMREFQLCFPLPDTQNLLIPALLPKEQPDNIDLPTDTLDFQYHYPILPDSILSRFIVLSHEKVHNNTYWRTGVLLEYSENGESTNLARIQSDPADSKIFIRISGRDQTRRSFLAIIRDTFTRIHRTFANLPIREHVPVPGHPTAEPLDYQELLGLEEMGDRTVTIGKLKLRLDLRQLLDGYESIEQRQIRRMGDRGDEFYEKVYDDLVDITRRAVDRPIHNTAEVTTVSNDKIWTGDRVETKLEGKYINNQSPNSMIGEQTIQGDNVQGNKIVNSQNLTEAAKDIKALIAQLSTDYDTTTPTGKRKLSDRILETLEGDRTIQSRALNALKEAGKTAFEEAIDHPVAKVFVAGLEGYLEG